MGGRAGGGGSGFGSGSRGGATERGYSAEMSKGVLSAEKSIAGNDFETLMSFDDKGNVTYTATGGKNYVYYKGSEVANKVVTHNHPKGSSFSADDLHGMVATNMKEMRISATEHIYSMKRPASGWGKSPKAVKTYATRLHNQALKAFNSQKTGNAASDRKLWIKLSTQATTKLAKSYGWDFTVKKNK